MSTILLTGIGGDIAQGVATLVRQVRPGVRLVGSDTHDEHAGRRYVDEVVRLPPATAENYPVSLRALLSRHAIDLVIPITEPEIGVMGTVLGESSRPPWISPGPLAVAAGIDKLATARALASLGVQIPWTHSTVDALPESYPCILKPRFGSGSRGIMTVDNEAEAHCLAKKFPEAVFQEFLEPTGGEITCAIYRTREGRTAILQLLRRMVGGLTGWAKVVRDEAVEHMCATIAQGLQVTGSMNVQLRITPNGPRVFEINPRFSSTVMIRHLLGFSDVLWTLDEFDGRVVNPTPIAPGQIAIRVQSAVFLE